MIILFDKSEKTFDTLGLGVLKDALTCSVKEELNGAFELEMTYPLTGNRYSEILLQRILLVKPNPYDSPQPFRIYSISKPIEGIVTINAEHLSYDASGHILKPFIVDDVSITDKLDVVLGKIQNEAFPKSDFVFTSYLPPTDTSFGFEKPANQRALLAGEGGSIIGIYGGELKYDKFNIDILSKRGTDRGVSIRYGKNLTAVEQKLESSQLYTGIFPHASTVISETTSHNEGYFPPTYIYKDDEDKSNMPYASDWLSLTNGGLALMPLVENTPVEIKTEEEPSNITAYIIPGKTTFSNEWLSLTEYIEGQTQAPLTPEEGNAYFIRSAGIFKDVLYIWTNGHYEEFKKVLRFYKTMEIDPYIEAGAVVDAVLANPSEPIETGNSFGEEWLTVEPDSQKVYKIITEGFFKDKLYVWVENKKDPTKSQYVIKPFLYKVETLPSLVNAKLKTVYQIPASGEEKPKNYVLHPVTGQFVEYKGSGFYYSYLEEGYKRPDFLLNRPVTTTSERTVYVDLTRVKDCYIRSEGTLFGKDWLSLNEDGEEVLIPEGAFLYKIKTEGEYKDGLYAWTGITYSECDKVYTNGLIYAQKEEGGDYSNYVPQRILNVNVSENIEGEPSAYLVYSHAMDFLTNHNLRGVKSSSTASFIKLSDSEEYKDFFNFEKIELGDWVEVKYEKLGIDTSMRISSTTYEVLEDKYSEVTLGEKQDTLTDNVLTGGDNVSQLQNDSNYSDHIAVANLISRNVTADYITAKDASFSEAQITTLHSQNSVVSGILEANSGYFDQLIARLLQVDDAEVSNVLKAGMIEVKGKIIATSGEISCEIKVGKNEDGSYNFTVDDQGNAVAKSLAISGGSIKLGADLSSGPTFEVDELGNVTATSFVFNQGGTTLIDGVFTTNDVRFTNGSKISSVSSIDYEYQTVSINVISLQKISGTLRDCEINVALNFFDKDGNSIPDGRTKTLTNVVMQIEGGRFNSTSISEFTESFLIPTGTRNTYTITTELGYSGSYEWFRLISSTPKIKTERISGDPGQLLINTVLLPETNGDLNLGSEEKKWNRIYNTHSQTIEMDIEHLRVSDVFACNTDSPAYFKSGIGMNGGLSSDGNLETIGLGEYNIGNAYFKWNTLYATNGTINTSDRNEKTEIEYDIQKYEAFFDKIKPVSYKFIKNESGRTHMGLISQDIEEALLASGLTSKDFAGFIKTVKQEFVDTPEEELTSDDYIYGLRYSEFHAMEINEIQKLKKEVNILKKELAELKELIINKED